MNKILKVKIQRIQTNGGTHYVYPRFYVPEKFQVLTYETQLTGQYDTVVNRGNKDEYVIGIVDEKDLDYFLQSSEIVEVNRNEAETFIGEDLTKSVDIITDTNKVLLVLGKVARDETVTANDKKVLDPNDPTTGIGRTKTLSEALDDHGV